MKCFLLKANLLFLCLIPFVVFGQTEKRGSAHSTLGRKLLHQCQKGDLIPASFPPNSLLKTIEVQDHILLVLENDASFGEPEEDTYRSLFLIMRNGKILYHHWQYAAALDDTDLTLENDLPVFSYYSSPVGYTEYYAYIPSEKTFFRTHKLDELESIDWPSFNLEKQTYRLVDKQEIFLLQLVPEEEE